MQILKRVITREFKNVKFNTVRSYMQLVMTYPVICVQASVDASRDDRLMLFRRFSHGPRGY